MGISETKLPGLITARDKGTIGEIQFFEKDRLIDYQLCFDPTLQV
jgi:hypothetical protein